MISALASPGAGHRILHPRTGDVNAIKHSLNGTELFIKPALGDIWTVIQDENHSSDVRKDISGQPLNSRAWTLQERLFAPRIIHYSAQQLIWQCKTCIASKDNQFEFTAGGQVISSVIDMINLDRERSGKNKRPTLLSTGWYTLLGGYTRRHVTYPSDLLPGISGLAREVQNLTGYKYLAGIWNGPPANLTRTLLWEAEHRRRKPTTRANNGSPSWIWVSVCAEITHPLHELFFLNQATGYRSQILALQSAISNVGFLWSGIWWQDRIFGVRSRLHWLEDVCGLPDEEACSTSHGGG